MPIYDVIMRREVVQETCYPVEAPDPTEARRRAEEALRVSPGGLSWSLAEEPIPAWAYEVYDGLTGNPVG